MYERKGFKKTSRAAFTLIELLVVIAIIAILAAILFPVFAAAREKARSTQCMSNEKQTGLGLLQYVSDFDECMPMASLTYTSNCTPNNGSYTCAASWRQMIWPYMKAPLLNACPDNPEFQASPNFVPGYAQGWAGAAAWDAPVGSAGAIIYPACPVSYAGNTSGGNEKAFATYPWVAAGVFESTGYSLVPIPLSSIIAPAQTIAASESLTLDVFDITNPNFAPYGFTSAGGNGKGCGIGNNAPNPPNTAWSCLFAGHQKLSNFLFCDGHVKAMVPLNTIDRASGGGGSTCMWFYDNTPLTYHSANPAAGISIMANAYGITSP